MAFGESTRYKNRAAAGRPYRKQYKEKIIAACTFRPAAPGDEKLILSFIRALADYEKMSDQVIDTPELLREWLFEKKTTEVIFAEAEG